MIKRFKPNKYIKNREKYSEYQCKICYELTDAPMRCRGPCRAVFCQHCITFTKNSADKCPLRCSNTFLVEQIPHLQFEYQCPFNPEKCELAIKQRIDFHNHHEHCQNVPKEYLTLINRKKAFICDKGHRLQLTNKFVYEKVYENQDFQNVYRLKCISCLEEGVCPSICLQCTRRDEKAAYCIDCRTIPCGKFECPLGHLWMGKSVDGFIGLKNSQICHMCGVWPGIVGKNAYFDTLCGLRLCEICYKALPLENELIPLKHPIYAHQQRKYVFSIAEFRRDQRLARQQYRAQLFRESNGNLEDLEHESSENSSDDSQMSRMRRFFRGEKIRHSSSQSSESEESQENEEPRERLPQQRIHFHQQQNAQISELVNQGNQNQGGEHAEQEEQDEFFSIESEPHRFQSQQQQDQQFLCASEENKSSEVALVDKTQTQSSDPPN